MTIVRAAPERTTADALAMGIDRRMSAYKTYNSGTSDRITNLRLGVSLLDDTLVAPGGTFSLNETIGERTVEKGFRSAPVIIGNEYAEEVGGGTSQVATTVFNAAWEAGLRITERNPHALYISRYQLGRDATVYWPSLDLKFENDTKHWVLVKGFAEYDGIVVSIYGGEDRRVDSSEGTMEITGPVVVERRKTPRWHAGRPSWRRRARRRARPRSRERSTTETAPSCARRPGTRRTNPMRESSASARRRRSRRSRLSRIRRSQRAKRRRPRLASAPALLLRSRRLPRPAKRALAPADRSRDRPLRGASTRRRPARHLG